MVYTGLSSAKQIDIQINITTVDNVCGTQSVSHTKMKSVN